MAYILSNKYAKTCCKLTILVQVIIEDVVTCFFGTQCITALRSIISICFSAKKLGNCRMVA